jgi:small subunit ribosomal protein S16
MAVRLRLTRVGSKKNPIWRIVVADQRSPRDGRFIETIGHYNPQTEPSQIVLDGERLEHWLGRGAQPTGTVRKLIRAHARSAGSTGARSAAAPAGDAPSSAGEPEPEAAPEPDSVPDATAAETPPRAEDAGAADGSA